MIPCFIGILAALPKELLESLPPAQNRSFVICKKRKKIRDEYFFVGVTSLLICFSLLKEKKNVW